MSDESSARDTKAPVEIVRLNVNLNAETAAALRRLAEDKNQSVTETVRRAIAILEFIEAESQAGMKFQISDPTLKSVRELVLL